MPDTYIPVRKSACCGERCDCYKENRGVSSTFIASQVVSWTLLGNQ